MARNYKKKCEVLSSNLKGQKLMDLQKEIIKDLGILFNELKFLCKLVLVNEVLKRSLFQLHHLF